MAKGSPRAPQAASSRPRRRNRRRGRTPAAHAPRVSMRTRMVRGWARMRGLVLRIRKPLLWAGRVVVLCAVTAGAVATGRLLERHVRSSVAFATRDIEVTGLSRLSREQVLAAAGLEL